MRTRRQLSLIGLCERHKKVRAGHGVVRLSFFDGPTARKRGG